jgi:hypothetical protein
MIDHREITLDSMSKLFDFERISREIDSVDDTETLRDISKGFVKLLLKKEELMSSMNITIPDK